MFVVWGGVGQQPVKRLVKFKGSYYPWSGWGSGRLPLVKNTYSPQGYVSYNNLPPPPDPNFSHICVFEEWRLIDGVCEVIDSEHTYWNTCSFEQCRRLYDIYRYTTRLSSFPNVPVANGWGDVTWDYFNPVLSVGTTCYGQNYTIQAIGSPLKYVDFELERVPLTVIGADKVIPSGTTEKLGNTPVYVEHNATQSYRYTGFRHQNSGVNNCF